MGDGLRRAVAESSIYATGLLSPDRSTIFDTRLAHPGSRLRLDDGASAAHRCSLGHFTLAGWSDVSTFFEVAERIDASADDVLRARQVVTLRPAGAGLHSGDAVARTEDRGQPPSLLVEGRRNPF
ncbi:MAG: hypothetical protein WB471_13535 [Nocardioides sp.]